MYFINTRGGEKVTGAQAIVQGLAKNGGLFVPEKFPTVTQEEIEGMAEMSYSERVAFILGKYLGEEFGGEFLAEACEKAYGAFLGDDPVPLVKVDGETGLYMLELYHGPTCSWKDIPLVLFPAILKKACELAGVKEEILLLSATNGDAGQATLESFRDAKGVKIAVFYPDEGVSKMQRFQLAVQDGKNAYISAVKGIFDDCQKTVRKLLVAEDFNEKLAKKGVCVTTASSINIACVLPQIAYYFSSYVDMLTSRQIEMGDGLDFVVPAGNCEDILAGWYAKQMGLPIRKIVCASNRNKTVADFFRKGSYEANRNLGRTTSPSLDILMATNIERLLFEVSGRDEALITKRMEQLAKEKTYSITSKEKAVLDKDFFSGFATEDQTVDAMYEIFDEYGYAMDTHTGVALAVYFQYLDAREKIDEKDRTPVVVLSTANPYKFPQDVLYALSGNDVKDSFKGVKRLNLLTAMKPPKSILAIRYRPLRFKGVIANDLAKLSDAVMKLADGEIVPIPTEN